MIILFGAAGSGKSLQGQRLADKYGWRWLSVGQLLRDCHDPELEKVMLKGELVNDDFVVKMMHEAIKTTSENHQNAILDGYPRNEWQTKWLIEHGDIDKIDGAIVIKVPDNELWSRLVARGRADDTRESIGKRWRIFEQTIYSMSNLLKQENVPIREVDGVGDVDEVTRRIEAVLQVWIVKMSVKGE